MTHSGLAYRHQLTYENQNLYPRTTTPSTPTQNLCRAESVLKDVTLRSSEIVPAAQDVTPPSTVNHTSRIPRNSSARIMKRCRGNTNMQNVCKPYKTARTDSSSACCNKNMGKSRRWSMRRQRPLVVVQLPLHRCLANKHHMTNNRYETAWTSPWSHPSA